MAVPAFDFSRADRQLLLASARIIQVIATLLQISMSSLSRALRRAFSGHSLFQAAQDSTGAVVQQSSLLSAPPFLFFARASDFGGRGCQVLAHVVKVDQ